MDCLVYFMIVISYYLFLRESSIHACKHRCTYFSVQRTLYFNSPVKCLLLICRTYEINIHSTVLVFQYAVLPDLS